MIIYDKQGTLYGTLNNIPDQSDEAVIYRDADGNKINAIPKDSYVDNKSHGIKRLSDNKEVNVFIGKKNVIPGNFIIPTVRTNPIKKEDYLYEIEYSSYDMENANKYFKKLKPTVGGKCSSVHLGNWTARNLDWTQDELVSFVVKTPAISGERHAVVGVADCVNALTKSAVESAVETGIYPYAFDYLPYCMVDGVNDAGVYVNSNIVLLDYGPINDTAPGKQDACTSFISRLILDYADNAKMALDVFSKYNFYGISKATGEESHWMIADKNSTYIVEFINNKLHIMSDQDDEYDDIPNKTTPIMTNFNLSNWNGVCKLVAQGDSESDVRATGLSPHSMGVERYKLLKERIPTTPNKDNMEELIDVVKYSKNYTNGSLSWEDVDCMWYTENVGSWPDYGLDDGTVYTSATDFMPVVIGSREGWRKDDRTGKFWQTVHCSVYDLNNKKLYLRVQEQDTEYVYSLPSA